MNENMNMGMGLQHVLHKHEQELLQKQQIYHSPMHSGYGGHLPMMSGSGGGGGSSGSGSGSGNGNGSGSGSGSGEMVSNSSPNTSYSLNHLGQQRVLHHPGPGVYQYGTYPSGLQQFQTIQQIQHMQQVPQFSQSQAVPKFQEVQQLPQVSMVRHVQQGQHLSPLRGQMPVAVFGQMSGSTGTDMSRTDDPLQAPQHVYQCHICDKQFRRKSWLKRHLLSHSNLKKFHCPWCSSTHKRKDNLLQHLKLKHTQILLQEFTIFGILLNVNNGSGNTANIVSTESGDKVWIINNDPAITIRDLLEANILPKDQVKSCLNYIVDNKCK